MTVFLISFLVIGIAILAMAIGVIAGRPEIKGSCGGLNQIGLESDCACSRQEREACPNKKKKEARNHSDP